MNLAHPTSLLATCYAIHQVYIKHDVPQYAAFLPKYFPRYGTMTIVNSSSNCCSDSFHSLSASDMYSSSSAEELVAEDGNESISSGEDGSMKSLLLKDMMAVVLGVLKEKTVDVWLDRQTTVAALVVETVSRRLWYRRVR
jgi:hypothetical protein